MIAFQRGDSDPIQVQATAEARLETFHLKQMQACARTDARSSRKNARKMCFRKLTGARACNICSTGGGARGRNYAHALHANVMRVRCCPKPFATSRRQIENRSSIASQIADSKCAMHIANKSISFLNKQKGIDPGVVPHYAADHTT